MVVDLNSMALFAAVVRAGSFTGAARAEGIPLPTLSRRIAELEQALGTRLLERTTRSLKVTEAGKVYLEHCRQVVAQADEAERSLQRLRQEPSGHLRLATPFAVDDSWATTVISSFLAKYPKISVEAKLVPDGTDPDDESLDLVLAYGDKPVTHHPVMQLGHARLALFASPAYLQRAGAPRTLAELGQHEFVHCTLLDWSRCAPPEFREFTPNVRVASNELLMARLSCIDGFGIGWLPQLSCVRALRAGALINVMPEYHFALPIWLVSRSASRSTPKILLLAEHLATLLGTQAAWDALERGAM